MKKFNLAEKILYYCNYYYYNMPTLHLKSIFDKYLTSIKDIRNNKTEKNSAVEEQKKHAICFQFIIA